MKLRPAALFSLVVLIFFCVFVYEAQEWRMQARLYPFAIGIPMLIFAIVQFILDLKGVKAKESSDGAPMDFQFSAQKEMDPALVKHRTIVMFSWMFGFLLRHLAGRLSDRNSTVGVYAISNFSQASPGSCPFY